MSGWQGSRVYHRISRLTLASQKKKTGELKEYGKEIVRKLGEWYEFEVAGDNYGIG